MDADLSPFFTSALPRESGDPGFFCKPRRPSIKHLGPRFRGGERGWGCGAFALSAVLAAPTLCLADPPDATGVPGVVITATQLPIELADTPDARVIDRTEIDVRQATFAADVLTTVPGLALTRVGAFGGVTSLHFGGTARPSLLLPIIPAKRK